MANKRKAYLLIELDADETAILPPHLRGMLSRPLVDPVHHQQPPAIQTRATWFPTIEERRTQRRKARTANKSKGE